eukprot:CAMPEP_0114581362 /NCGR_PEP_ID=MMETSP0125-20121206/5477_1 /TAXON_ID=485358 ORGANISM="Aristerostoma sp., Strain ATCC 50986" /NCGR_SAMPLE_ID=MMETSP0125 /ASSEMBLY_ACC=CAM_ASM_000245 /LENGTH=100 /DNA_ID=CAMNT_0001773507 /DNA_START=795 /DNA_END=1097 /DNA_ORIENTATION=+
MIRLKEKFNDIRVESPENKSEVIFEFEPRNEVNVFGSLAKIFKQNGDDYEEQKISDKITDEEEENKGEKIIEEQPKKLKFDGYILKESENEFIVLGDDDV